MLFVAVDWNIDYVLPCSSGVGMYTLFIVWAWLGTLPTSSCWYVHLIGPKKGHMEVLVMVYIACSAR